MSNETLDNLSASVARAKGAMASATVLINGIRERVKAAVAEALANGATAEELAPFAALDDDLDATTAELSSAVADNP